MGIYPLLFFPHASNAEVDRLRMVARSIAASRARRRVRADVAGDVGALGLVLLGLVGTLVEKGVLTNEELLAHLRRVDELDGVADGKVTPDQVRAALGLAQPDPGPTVVPKPKRKRS